MVDDNNIALSYIRRKYCIAYAVETFIKAG